MSSGPSAIKAKPRASNSSWSLLSPRSSRMPSTGSKPACRAVAARWRKLVWTTRERSPKGCRRWRTRATACGSASQAQNSAAAGGRCGGAGGRQQGPGMAAAASRAVDVTAIRPRRQEAEHLLLQDRHVDGVCRALPGQRWSGSIGEPSRRDRWTWPLLNLHVEAGEEVRVVQLGLKHLVLFAPGVRVPQLDVVVHACDHDLVGDACYVAQPLRDHDAPLAVRFGGVGLGQQPAPELPGARVGQRQLAQAIAQPSRTRRAERGRDSLPCRASARRRPPVLHRIPRASVSRPLLSSVCSYWPINMVTPGVDQRPGVPPGHEKQNMCSINMSHFMGLQRVNCRSNAPL